MGCGCSGGGSSSSSSVRVQSLVSRPAVTPPEGCPYTLEMIQDWLTKVNCFKDNGYYTAIPNISLRQLNTYIGILLSAFNYSTNICYLESQLNDVKNFITVIISTGQC